QDFIMRLFLLFLLIIYASYALSNYKDQRAFLAFELNNEKLASRVIDLYNAARIETRVKHDSSDCTLGKEFGLINFFYDESQHDNTTISEILSDAAAVICSRFPGYLAFDDFELKGESIKVTAENFDIHEFKVAFAKVLNDHGVVFSNYFGPNSSTLEFSAIRSYPLLLPYSYSYLIKDLLLMPLHASFFVDTLVVCLYENGRCKVVGSHKIEKC
ncbi:hypothetical protein PENTCL1PPCAC_25466, partial [Pristionchus entomophagus]